MTDIKRFYRNKKYIGIDYHTKDCSGGWYPGTRASCFNGKPRSAYDDVIEYSDKAWNDLLNMLKKQAEELCKEVVSQPTYMYLVTKWE